MAWSPSSPAAGRCINIDFTGGTLVTIRLNESDPTVQSLSESRRAEFVRQKASVLPDVTVESLRVGNDTKLARFNIRTTQPTRTPSRKDKVKNKIIEAFGPALAKVEMTVGDAKPIPSAAAGDASKTSPALTTRFAGGREYPLSFNTTAFNSTQAPAQVVAAEFAKVLEGAGIANPTTRFEISRSTSQGIRHRQALTSCCGPTWSRILPRPRSASSRSRWPATATFSSSESRSSAAPWPARPRTLALIATVASWVIIIVYLWWRFHSFTYGLAAVLAVVHDVLITLGAIALSYWLARIPIISSLFMIDQFKIDLPIVAAFLTLIGFSINDTIVIFDRIREIKGKTPHLTNKMVNDAINQTLSRTDLDRRSPPGWSWSFSTSSAARACTASPSPSSSAS